MITLSVSARRPIVIVDATTDDVEVLFDKTKFSRPFVGVKRTDSTVHTVTLKNDNGSTITTLSGNQSVIVGPGSGGLWNVIADLGSTITVATTTNLTGYLKGNGTNVSAVTTIPNTDITGLGTAAVVNTGTSGGTVPLLNTNVIWTGTILTNGFGLRDTGFDHYLNMVSGENLTSSHTLTVVVNDANRTLIIAADSTISGINTGDQTRSSLGLDTTDSPQFTAINIGHATDTTISRLSAGNVAVEGNELYRVGGTDASVADGGTGRSSHTAYMPIVGGTTTTAAQQSVATGTAGQLLSYVSSSAVPTFIDPITNTQSESVLAADYVFTTAAGTYGGTGLTTTIPSAGKYLIYMRITGQNTPNTGTTWFLVIKIRNTTDSTDVARTEQVICYIPTATGSIFDSTIVFAIQTFAASKTFEVYVKRDGTGTPTWVDTRLNSSSSGSSVIGYIKQGN